MSDATIPIFIDDEEISARPGQTILQAAEDAGIYIPRLCAHKDLQPHGSCRVCTVKVNGRPQSACTQPVAPGQVIDNETEEIQQTRRAIVDMLFIEGNHICPFCEKSGDCELQALAYRLGIPAPKYPYLFPKRDVDASHAAIMLDHNRCVLCGRCVRASRDIDGKHVFDFVGRGIDKKVAVNSEAMLGGTDLDVSDKAVEICPVGAILRKRVGYKVPVGQRTYDEKPIGSDIEMSAARER